MTFSSSRSFLIGLILCTVATTFPSHLLINRAFLEPGTAVVFAEGHGYPWMNLSSGDIIATHLAGADKQFIGATARSLTHGDFDEDGRLDLIEGYAHDGTGFMAFRSGIEELGPQHTRISLSELAVQPDFLGSGDFDADGHLDVVAASRTNRRLMWLRGDGSGRFGRPQMVTVPGIVTALSIGDLNRRDGLQDVAVSVQNEAGAVLLVFEHPEGAFGAEPSRQELPEPALDFVIEELGRDGYADLVAAGRNTINVLRGMDRYWSAGTSLGVPQRLVGIGTLRSVHPIAALAAGDYRGNTHREVAVVYKDGAVSLFDLKSMQLETTPVLLPGVSDGKLTAGRARMSSLRKDELLVLDADAKRLHVVHGPAFDGKGYPANNQPPEADIIETGLAQTQIDLGFSPVAFNMMPINRDALDDVVMLGSARTSDGRLQHGTALSLTQHVINFVVNSTENAGDREQGDGICETFQGECTLTAAWQEANASPGQDLITFAIPELSDNSSAFFSETVIVDGSSQGRVVLTSIETRDDNGNSMFRSLVVRDRLQFRSDDGGNIVYDSYLGTSADGLNYLHSRPGMQITGSAFNTVGGTSEDRRNIVSAITINSSAHDNEVQGNYIGVTPGGTDIIRPVSDDIEVRRSGVDIGSREGVGNIIGGTEPGSGNVIAGHLEYGVEVSFAGAENHVLNNLIGMDATGTMPLPNGKGGIEVSSTERTVIGSAILNRGNVIGGNEGDQEDFFEGSGVNAFSSNELVVVGNIIGLERFGREPLGNIGHGIVVRQMEQVVIGGSFANTGNTIGWNGKYGIFIFSTDTVIIQQNNIGTDVTGTRPAGNILSGINIVQFSEAVRIGGRDLVERNVISANQEHGFFSENSGEGIEVFGNYIGTDRTETLDLGNQGDGIHIDGTRGLRIGFEDVNFGNTIAFNAGRGIAKGVSPRALYQANSIFSNGELGIDVEIGNPAQENDNGVNNPVNPGSSSIVNFPVLTALSGGRVQVDIAGRRDQTYRIELFGNQECDDTGYGEGERFLDAFEMTTDSDGVASLERELSVSERFNLITASMSDVEREAMSEFSTCTEVEGTPVLRVQVMTDPLGRTAQPVAATRLLVGTVDLSNPTEPFSDLISLTTDADGMLELEPGLFAPGAPIYVRTPSEFVPAVKLLHDEVDNVMFERYVDNLVLDQDGNIEPARLSETESVITRTFLGHAVMGLNLVIGIEWRASTEYVDKLMAGLRNASNYLFDITNGHAYLNKIAIYDNREVWRMADVQFYVNNTVWPSAVADGIERLPFNTGADTDQGEQENGELSVLFPPVNFGGLGAEDVQEGGDPSDVVNVNNVYNEPLDPSLPTHWRTLIHELGHYAFGFDDEYINQAGMRVWPGDNFGFMDNQYIEPMGSEMSASATTFYQDTRHFQSRGGTTNWSFFKNRHDGAIDGVPFIIHPPADWGWQGVQIMRGPNNDLSAPDFDVGAIMTITSNLSGDPLPRTPFLVTVDGAPAPGTSVRLIKQDAAGRKRAIDQGKTVFVGENRGRIRVFEFDASLEQNKDMLLAHVFADRREYSFFIGEPDLSATKLLDDEILVELNQPTGDQALIPALAFGDDGSLIHILDASNQAFATPPTLESLDGETADPVVYGQDGTNWVAPVPEGLGSGSTLLTMAPDTDGNAYPVVGSVTLFGIEASSTQLHSSNGNLDIFMDPSATTLEQLAVLSTRFPAPSAGLPDDVAQASALHALTGFPTGAAPNGRLEIIYQADSLLASVPEAVTIYQWDGTRWNALETAVDITEQVATAAFESFGVYAVFLDLNQTTMVDVEEDAVPEVPARSMVEANYPNPFTSQTTVPFTLSERSIVEISVYDTIGRKVAELTNQTYEAGRHEVSFDAENLPPGMYFFEVRIGEERQVQKMVRLR